MEQRDIEVIQRALNGAYAAWAGSRRTAYDQERMDEIERARKAFEVLVASDARDATQNEPQE